MGPQFFETRMGQKFYEGTMPKIAKALEAIAEQLTVQTVLQHAELPQPARPHNLTPEELRTALADPAERAAERLATLSTLYPDLTVEQLEALDRHAGGLDVG